MLMAFEFAAKSDVGKVRKNNEDSFIIDEGLNLVVVADGMGGHNSGEVASKMACELINKNLRQPPGIIYGTNNPKISQTANMLASAIRLANNIIFESSQTYSNNKGMGTTVVTALIKNNTYIIAWVGDSRIYLIRNNQMLQLSKDHSLVQEQIDKGLITPEQAEKSEYKNILTRAIGAAENVEADIIEIPVFDDDYLLLCSDGLTKTLTDTQIFEIIKNNSEPRIICEQLINYANNAGGKDNITAAVMHNKSISIWDKLINLIGK